MSVETPPFALQASTYSAETTRRAIYALLKRGAAIGSVSGGLIGTGDMLVTAGSGMQVLVAPGEGIIPGSASATQSGYYGRVASSTTLPIAASDPTNPRIDRVVAMVKDAAYSGTENLFTLAVLTGTPTSGATLGNYESHGYPEAPASSLTLGPVLVPAKATSIVSGDIENVATLVDLGIALGAESVLTAAIAKEAVTDTKIVKGRALVDTENKYSAQVERAEGEYEPSPTRPAHVILTVYLTSSSPSRLTVTIGGKSVTTLGDDTTLPAGLPSFPVSFYVPPGVKWGIILENIVKVEETHILF